MDHSWSRDGNEVIEPALLQGLAILSKASGHSLVEELNNAVSSYLVQELPPKLGEDGLSLFVGEMHGQSKGGFASQ